jgi:hypothetical protein
MTLRPFFRNGAWREPARRSFCRLTLTAFALGVPLLDLRERELLAQARNLAAPLLDK